MPLADKFSKRTHYKFLFPNFFIFVGMRLVGVSKLEVLARPVSDKHLCVASTRRPTVQKDGVPQDVPSYIAVSTGHLQSLHADRKVF